MIFAILSWLVFAIGVGVSVSGFLLYIHLRSLSNLIMAKSGDEFHKAAASLMTASDELPEGILTAIEVMEKIASAKNGHRVLLQAFRQKDRNENVRIGSKTNPLETEAMELRPELRQLFEKLVISWLSYVSHQNFVTQARLGIRLLRLKSKGLDTQKAEAKAGVDFLKNFGNLAC